MARCARPGATLEDVSTIVALHLGSLHPVEQVLTLVLAFGPFLVLGIVIWLRQRER